MQKPYLGLGRVSRVRLGPGRITKLRHFPCPGMARLARLGRVMAQVTGLGRVSAGLAGLSLGKAKTSPQAGFSLIPQPELG
jgi:hypothetical protein